MYSVETADQAIAQLDALPAEALPHYAELVAMLQLAPWAGRTYDDRDPDLPTRSQTFGDRGQGLAIYLVLERQRRVCVLRLHWH